MPDSIYYLSTISLYSLTVLLACIIPDVDVIFEFVATISVNCLAFIFPAVFYLMAKHKYRNQHDKVSVHLVRCAYLQLAMGILAFVAGMTNNIYGIISGDDADSIDEE